MQKLTDVDYYCTCGEKLTRKSSTNSNSDECKNICHECDNISQFICSNTNSKKIHNLVDDTEAFLVCQQCAQQATITQNQVCLALFDSLLIGLKTLFFFFCV